MRPFPLLATVLFTTTLFATALAAPAHARAVSKDADRYSPIPGAKAENCLPLPSIRETRVRDDNTIDFIVSGRKLYRNTLPQSCPQLGFEQSFSYATSLSQLCSVDIITVLNRGGGGLQRGASCGLGQFQPMQKTR